MQEELANTAAEGFGAGVDAPAEESADDTRARRPRRALFRDECGLEMSERAVALSLVAIAAVVSFETYGEAAGAAPEQRAKLMAAVALLVPVTALITYYDVRYRRIPNPFVLATLAGGLLINGLAGGGAGVLTSLGGCLLAFALMVVLHVLGTLGAADVKLFAAIGAVVGLKLVLPTFVAVALMGGALALITMAHSRIRHGKMAGASPVTIPYGVAIMLGSLISIAFLHA